MSLEDLLPMSSDHTGRFARGEPRGDWTPVAPLRHSVVDLRIRRAAKDLAKLSVCLLIFPFDENELNLQ